MHMIQSYIRDPKTRELWDITRPEIQSIHREITRGWIETADLLRKTIKVGENQWGEAVTDVGALQDWIYGNIRRLQEIAGFEAEKGDYIMDAYLEWGVRNYPITNRITQHTLEALERMYNGDPDDMMWDQYISDIADIASYQTDRNRKAPQAMTREEMLRRAQSYDTDTLRKMLTAVEYQTKA